MKLILDTLSNMRIVLYFYTWRLQTNRLARYDLLNSDSILCYDRIGTASSDGDETGRRAKAVVWVTKGEIDHIGSDVSPRILVLLHIVTFKNCSQ